MGEWEDLAIEFMVVGSLLAADCQWMEEHSGDVPGVENLQVVFRRVLETMMDYQAWLTVAMYRELRFPGVRPL